MMKDTYKRICEAAKQYNVEIYREVPEGFAITAGAMTAPIGSIWINNEKSRFSMEFINALVLDNDYFIKEIERGINEYKALMEKSKEADLIYEADYTNKDKETAAVRVYREAFNKYIETSELLAQLTGIAPIIARKMIREQSNEVLELLRRYKAS